jgi:hypothetical protein
LKHQGVWLSKPKAYGQFVESAPYKQFLSRFATLIGTNESIVRHEQQLTDQLKLVYSVCIYERAIQGKSIWCRLFSDREFQLIEYANDLNVYFAGAYGLDINRRLTCGLLIEILHAFRASQTNRKRRTVRLNFTHAGLLKRLFTMFGISPQFASSHCRSGGSCSDQWRTSLLLPFLANFELTLYECPSTRPEWFVLAKVQEHPIQMNGCDHVHCPLDQFLASYDLLARNCDLKQICRL